MTDSRAIGRSTETDCSAADPVRRAVGDYSGTWGSIEVRAADASQAAATDSLAPGMLSTVCLRLYRRTYEDDD